MSQEIAFTGKRVNAVNVGMVGDKEHLNMRAIGFRRLREWLKKGGELINDKGREDLLMMRYRRETNGKIKMMGKQEMRKEYGKSPDCADAAMLTFFRPDSPVDMNSSILQER